MELASTTFGLAAKVFRGFPVLAGIAIWGQFVPRAEKTAKVHKKFKGLKKENLRDNMTNKELVINMLAELSTKEISEVSNPETFPENEDVARRGSNIAKEARLKLEAETGKKVVSLLNAKSILSIGNKKDKKKDNENGG